MSGEVPVSNPIGFRKGDVLVFDGGDEAFVVADVTSNTLTIKPRRWWHRVWAWFRVRWPFRLWLGRGA